MSNQSTQQSISKKPKVVLTPHFRKMDEIFSEEALKRLHSFADVVWGKDEPLPDSVLEERLADMWAFVGARPIFDRSRLDRAKHLKAIIEVGGHFMPEIDYETCFERGIRVLSCAPAFGRVVAEMGLAMTLASCRGVVAAHEDFRKGSELWLGQGERSGFDFTLHGESIGFIGFGSLARNLMQLLQPFHCRVKAYDPWLPDSFLLEMGAEPATLEEVLSESRIVYVMAVPTAENKGLIDREKLAMMRKKALLVLISRAHLVDFDALTEAVLQGDIQAAIDVFPEEPLPLDHPIRQAPNVILSAHRAAAIATEHRTIGDMVVDDLELMSKSLPPARLQRAEPELIVRRLGK